MITISICIGSACHMQGAHGVLEAFKNLIAKYKVDDRVELEGHFCHGRCTEGVVVTINDLIITDVAKDKVFQIFEKNVLEVIDQ